MRVLKFIVDGQTISPDPSCNFENLILGTKGYLTAEFTFSKEWESCTKVAAFFSNLGTEYEPQVIKSNNTCLIPNKALEKSIFKIQVFGQHKDYKLCTNKVAVHQKRG